MILHPAIFRLLSYTILINKSPRHFNYKRKWFVIYKTWGRSIHTLSAFTFAITASSFIYPQPKPIQPLAPALGCNCVSSLHHCLRSRQLTLWPRNFALQNFSCAPNTPAPERHSCCWYTPPRLILNISGKLHSSCVHDRTSKPFLYPTILMLSQSPGYLPECALNWPYRAFLRPLV